MTGDVSSVHECTSLSLHAHHSCSQYKKHVVHFTLSIHLPYAFHRCMFHGL